MTKAKLVQAVMLAGVLGVGAWGIQEVQVEEATAQTTHSFVLFDTSNGSCPAGTSFLGVTFAKNDGADNYLVTTTNGSSLDGYCGTGNVDYRGDEIDLWTATSVTSGGYHGMAGGVNWTPGGSDRHLTSISDNGDCSFEVCTQSSCGNDWTTPIGDDRIKIGLKDSGGSLFCGYTGQE